ncbi:ABC transporter permease [Microbacterium sp. STN6]|uniref:ABC transporter permease n=1 Tax=Microbacterium sp. STN6 TaxID=2995588 RepID=UPI002260FE24|nr:ABC transporter permease [Microbacterium sp. STN6]MCX7521129.1 ABC transporter permease [Microbacterium sp. STN6]
MTTIAETQSVARRGAHPSSTTRIWRVVKLQFTNSWNILVLPVLILGAIFVLNYAIWVIAFRSSDMSENALDGTQYSGSTIFIFAYMLVVAIQAINLTFPFALGYGATRRDYYLGTSLTWLILSAILTLGIAICGQLETWTNGWGLRATFFNAVYFGDDSFAARMFTVFAAFLFFFFVGTASAAVYVRWRANGLIVAGLVLAVLLVGAVALISFTDSWKGVGEWFAVTGGTGVVAWSLVVTAIAAVTGFFILRRATPKS